MCITVLSFWHNRGIIIIIIFIIITVIKLNATNQYKTNTVSITVRNLNNSNRTFVQYTKCRPHQQDTVPD